MGPLGTLLVGALVGCVGGLRHPAGRARRVWRTTAIAAAAALAAKYAGDATGTFSDGQSVEWLASVAAAALAAALIAGFSAGKRR